MGWLQHGSLRALVGFDPRASYSPQVYLLNRVSGGAHGTTILKQLYSGFHCLSVLPWLKTHSGPLATLVIPSSSPFKSQNSVTLVIKHQIPQNSGNMDLPLEDTALPAGAPTWRKPGGDGGPPPASAPEGTCGPGAGSVVLSRRGCPAAKFCLRRSSSPHPVTGQRPAGPLGDITPHLAPLPTLAPALGLVQASFPDKCL